MGCKKIELTEEQKQYVLDQVLLGESIVTICKHLNISERTFFYLKKQDPLFAKEFAEVRVESQHLRVERLRTIYDTCETMADAQIARGISDNIKWEASKRCPEVYGDSINVNVNHVDLTAVLSAAAGRAIPFIEMRQALEIDKALTNNADSNADQSMQVIENTEKKSDD